MLIEFTFNNILSFRDETYFSMQVPKGSRKANEFDNLPKGLRLYKSAVVFGPNAGGKSNLLNSIESLQYLLNGFFYYPSFANNDEPIQCNIVFLKNNLIYSYSVKWNREEILKEKLVYQESGKEVTYFEREDNRFLSLTNKSLQPYAEKVPNNSCFVSTMRSNVFTDPHLKNVFDWFNEDLVLVRDRDDNGIDATSIVKQENTRNKVLQFLQLADFSIKDIEVINRSYHNKVIEARVYEELIVLTHQHREEDFKLTLNQESLGTQKFFFLVLTLLSNQNKTIILDEFDASLHRELATALLELFNSPESNNQLIVTSHNLQLMKQNLKDGQIWFTERDNEGASNLFSVYDFKKDERNQDAYTAYQQGRFGAKPIILVDALKELLRNFF